MECCCGKFITEALIGFVFWALVCVVWLSRVIIKRSIAERKKEDEENIRVIKDMKIKE